MRDLFRGLPTMLSNTHIEMTMTDWPAAVSVLGLCGVFITAILAFTHSGNQNIDTGGDG